MQKLILPINMLTLTCGYKTPWYPKNMNGLTHYGVDAVSLDSRRSYLYGCGKGEVIVVGHDKILGNVVAIRYNDCQLTDGSVKDLIVRYCHLKENLRKVGDRVTIDTLIGWYGNTGKYSNGAHLHYEVDTDCAYPLHTPTLSKDSNIFKASPKGHDSTINPTTCMYIKTTKPESQKVCVKYATSVSNWDTNYQKL